MNADGAMELTGEMDDTFLPYSEYKGSNEVFDRMALKQEALEKKKTSSMGPENFDELVN